MKKARKSIRKGINALVWKEADLYVAKAIEVEVASQGKTPKQALGNLEEAVELYFEDEKIKADRVSRLERLKLYQIDPKVYA